MMLAHIFDQDVLVICCPSGISVGDRAAAAVQAEDLISGHPVRHVVIEILPGTVTPVVVSLVARIHRMCAASGITLVVAADSPEARRPMTANAAGCAPPLFATRAEAVRQARNEHKLAS
ncbi:hypothetical protein [Streptomyces purpureus]|uniref:hypothetical protein n=1 Tax=Streptomyces purpureus TaxID=1951 RepID=UPI00068E3FE8|nr:hypothetical protein [Streptomyces purpureus]